MYCREKCLLKNSRTFHIIWDIISLFLQNVNPPLFCGNREGAFLNVGQQKNTLRWGVTEGVFAICDYSFVASSVRATALSKISSTSFEGAFVQSVTMIATTRDTIAPGMIS